MIARIAGFLFFLSAAGYIAGVMAATDVMEMVESGIWMRYSLPFFASFFGAYCGRQKHDKSNPGQAMDKEFLSKVYLFAGGLGVVLFGLYDVFYMEGDWEEEAFLNPFALLFFMFVGTFAFFCASLIYDGNTPSRREGGESASDGGSGGVLFFLSWVGVLSVALLFGVFVLFQETIPYWEDDYVLDNLEAVMEEHCDFLSYLSENHLGHLPWAVLAILAFSLLLAANRRKIPFTPRRVFGTVLTVGSLSVIFNFPALLVHAWHPYVWFLFLALLAAIVAGGNILRGK